MWSLRLGLHIARRTVGIKDDPRYGKMIAEWGADASRQMFFLAQKQALVSIPLALSMVLAAWNPLAGFARARCARRRGADRGHRRRGHRRRAVAALPRRSGQPRPDLRRRAMGLVAASELFLRMARLARLSAARHRSRRRLSCGAGRRWPGRPACIGCLVHVSGIPPLEEHMLERRRDEFRAYQARTNAFFPGAAADHLREVHHELRADDDRLWRNACRCPTR